MATYDFDTIRQLVDAFNNAGFSAEELTRLRTPTMLERVKEMVKRPNRLTLQEFLGLDFKNAELVTDEGGIQTRGPISKVIVEGQMLSIYRSSVSSSGPLPAENLIRVHIEHFRPLRLRDGNVWFEMVYLGGYTIEFPK